MMWRRRFATWRHPKRRSSPVRSCKSMAAHCSAAERRRLGFIRTVAYRSYDQTEVAELVPQVSLRNGLAVGAIEEGFGKKRSQQVEMTGLRLVESGQQTIDDTQRRPWAQSESGPSLDGACVSVLSGGRLQRPHHRGAHGNHARCPVDGLSGIRRDSEPFFEEWMLGIDRIVLERAQACVQEDVAEADALATQIEEQLPTQRSSGRGCFGRARLVGVDGLVVR